MRDAAVLLSRAAKKRGAIKAILVRTEHNSLLSEEIALDNVLIIDSTTMAIEESLTDLSVLAREALNEYERGETEELNPDLF